jgi:septum formation protein
MEGIINILLASGSPRRKELFALTGWSFVVQPVHLDEGQRPNEPAEVYVNRLAQEKAESATAESGGAEIVLGADTIVLHNRHVLGKPNSAGEAERTLLDLMGKEHTVITAIFLIDRVENRLKLDYCTTSVPMREYSFREVQEYVDSGDPLDKAGAYAIQNANFSPVAVEQMTGCFANVMGLPLCHLVRSMREWNIDPPKDVPRACIAHTRYDCTVYSDILDHRQ